MCHGHPSLANNEEDETNSEGKEKEKLCSNSPCSNFILKNNHSKQKTPKATATTRHLFGKIMTNTLSNQNTTTPLQTWKLKQLLKNEKKKNVKLQGIQLQLKAHKLVTLELETEG